MKLVAYDTLTIGPDDGTGAPHATVTPGSLTIPCNSSGGVKTAMNNQALAFSLTVGGQACASVKAVQKSGTTLPTGVTLTSSGGTVTKISIATTASASGMAAGVTFTVSGTLNGNTYSDECTLALIGSVAGQDVVQLVMTNDFMMVPTDANGVVTETTSVTAYSAILVGAHAASDQTRPSASKIIIKSNGSNTDLYPTYSPLSGTSNIFSLTWTFNKGVQLIENNYNIPITSTYNGNSYSSSVIIAASKGKPVYELGVNLPAIPFKKDSNNLLTPASAQLSVDIWEFIGDAYTTYSYSTAKSQKGIVTRYTLDGSRPTTSSSEWGSGTGNGISWSNGKMVIANTTTVNNICIAIFSSSGSLLDFEGIPVVKDGIDGKDGKDGKDGTNGTNGTNGINGTNGHVGRWYYYAGPYSSSTTYTMGETQAPYVKYNNKFWMLVASSAKGKTPADGSSYWEEMQSDFQYYIAKAFFGAYAELGSFIVNGDWMISQYGKLYYPEGTSVNIDSSNYQQQYNYKLPYQWFDPSYPNINKTNDFNFCPAYAVDGLTGKVYMNQANITGKVVATSGSFTGTVNASGGSITGDMTVTGNLTIGNGNVKLKLEPLGSGSAVGASIKAVRGNQTPFSLTFTDVAYSGTNYAHAELLLESTGPSNMQYGKVKINDMSMSRTLYYGDLNSYTTYKAYEGLDAFSNIIGMVHRISVNSAYYMRMGISSVGKAIIQADSWPTASDLSSLPVGSVYRDGAYLKVKTS